MEKQLIVRFLNTRRRGVYDFIVDEYANSISMLTVKMAKELIEEDLEKVAGTTIKIHYSSLAKARARFKKGNGSRQKEEKPKQWNFKDSYEEKSKDLAPGYFDLSNRKSQ